MGAGFGLLSGFPAAGWIDANRWESGMGSESLKQTSVPHPTPRAGDDAEPTALDAGGDILRQYASALTALTVPLFEAP